MIYENQILLFISYSGDSDSWARSASKEERQTLSNDIWNKLDDIVNRLALLKTGTASIEFISATDELLKSEIPNTELVQKLYNLK
jgi:hypothetical protein